MALRDRLIHAWNAFVKDERLGPGRVDSEPSYYDRPRSGGYRRSISEQTTVASIYNRIAIDCAAHPVRHVRVDDSERFLEIIRSRLDDVLNVEANLDQNGRQMLQDAYQTICEEGDIALVAVETDIDPESSGSFIVGNVRVGTIVERKASRVKVKAWNEKKGAYEEIWQGKRYTPIVQNPLYAVMNQPNSTLQRLMLKLTLLDTADELVASGKLDIIIQLPYAIKSETRRAGAEQRRKDMETQLKGSKYGVAYADATEKITQLNRPAENNLLAQVEWLTQKAYSELGLTKEIMDGTADEAAMVNYYNRTIEPMVAQLVAEIKRKWLTRTARTQGQSIMAFRDPFRNMPLSQMAEVADKFSRNEILTSNEIRQGIGYKPSSDPKADELVNSANRKVGEDQPLSSNQPASEDPEDLGASFEAELDAIERGGG